MELPEIIEKNSKRMPNIMLRVRLEVQLSEHFWNYNASSTFGTRRLVSFGFFDGLVVEFEYFWNDTVSSTFESTTFRILLEVHNIWNTL